MNTSDLIEKIKNLKNFVVTQPLTQWLSFEVVYHSKHVVPLLTGKHKGQGLPQNGTLSFWLILLVFLITSATKRIVGISDSEPIGALLVPVLTLGGAYLVSVLKQASVVPAFMLIAIAVNLILVASVAVGLDHRIYQWVLDFWLYGASAYYAYQRPSDSTTAHSA